MTRDSYDRFTPRQRGLFGDNESAPTRHDDVERTRLTDVTLCLRQERPTSSRAASEIVAESQT